MTLRRRVIPCLDVHDGHVTRGLQFGRAESGGLKNVGDPVELAIRYNQQGADEMVFFDITATDSQQHLLSWSLCLSDWRSLRSCGWTA